MAVPEEARLFASLAVSQSLCTKEQVEECLATLERLAEAGITPLPSLGELLRRRGYLNGAPQAESTLRASGPAARPGEQGLPSEVREAEGIAGNVFGKYVRTSKLGAGAMGEVWKAWDRELGRFIALKFLKHDDPAELARFRREAQTAGKLTHPNIAATYEVGEAQGRHFIAMQLVEGQTLESFPRDGVKRLVEIVRQAALAVDYAHGQDVIHRDLKPGNIMVSASGRGRDHAYVMDFGLARSAQLGSSLSVSGAIIGTPAFMSPEQAEGRRVDRRCDVYSLGATLYALLCDTPPFSGESLLETLRKVAHDDPVPPRRLNARIPNDLETIILKCLEKNPARRYAAAAALAEELDRWARGEAIDAHPPSAVYLLTKKLSKHRVKAVAAASLLVLAGGFGAFQLHLRGEAHAWAEEAKRHAHDGDFEEAKRLLDQARTRVAVDPELYHRCEVGLAERRETSELKKKEDEILGPVRERLSLIPATPEGWRRGLRLLDDAIVHLPRSWDAWIRKGHLHHKLGEADEGLAAYGRALELNPAVRSAHYWRGRILMEQKKDLAAAATEFAKAESDNEYALLARARIELLGGRAKEVLRLCEQAEPVGKHLSELHFVRGYVYSDAASGVYDPDRAIASYSETIRREPAHAVAWNNRSYMKFKTRDLDGAIQDATEAIRLLPSDGAAFVNRALARRAQGEVDASTADFTEAIRLSPSLAEAWMGRGINHDMRGKQDLALADYEAALRADPRHGASYGYRGRIRYERDDLPGARADLDRAIELGAKNVMVYEHRALVRRAQGDPKGALEDFDEAVRLNPRLPQPYLNRAETKAALSDRAGARADYEAALRVAPPEWPSRGRVQQALDRLR